MTWVGPPGLAGVGLPLGLRPAISHHRTFGLMGDSLFQRPGCILEVSSSDAGLAFVWLLA
jgi:hypothetical protein